MDWITSILLVCLAVVFFQDIKYRKIHIVLPILIFTLSFGINYSRAMSRIVFFNIVFFSITIAVLTLYMSVKNKTFLNPFTHYFGIGDLLFYVAVSPLFYLHNYVLYFILSMVFSLLLHLAFRKPEETTVPLAGFASLFLLLVIAKDLLLDYGTITLIK